MKYKSNHNLLLPDGKTEVEAGEVFEYDGDISSFAGIIEPVIEPEAKEEAPKNDENPKNDPEGKEAPAAFGLEGLSDEEIRAQGKAWKIKNYHSMGIENLKKKIYEAYAAAAPDAPEELKKPDAGFEVDNVPEDPEGDENPKAGESNE